MTTPTLVVTGAGGGLGRALLDLLSIADANVVCVDHSEVALADALAAVGNPDRLVGVAADVADEADVRAVVATAESRWGPVTGLINAAAILGTPRAFTEIDDDEFDAVMRVNTRGVWLTMKHILPGMVAAGGGAIVNIGSYAAIRAAPGIAPYAASKHAVVGLTQTVAVEYAKSNVRANVVCPGSMDTDMIRRMFPLHGKGDAAEGERITLAKIPQGRLAQPTELAQTALWLVLEAPAHLSGQVIAVDGARSAS